MNIQQVDRLQGLLSRVLRNGERPRIPVGLVWPEPSKGQGAPVAVAKTPAEPARQLLDEPFPLVASADLTPEPLPLVTPLRPAPAEPQAAADTSLCEPAAMGVAPDAAAPVPGPSDAVVSSRRPVLSLVEEADEEELLEGEANDDRVTSPPSAPFSAKTYPEAGARVGETFPSFEVTPAPPAASSEDSVELELDVPSANSAAPVDETELIPDSGRRTREEEELENAPESLDAALASAAEAYGPGTPSKTPPPESGDQFSIPAPPADAGVDREHGFSSVVPTSEQLGEVIDLEEPTGASLELAEIPLPPVSDAETKPEELEFIPATPATLAPALEAGARPGSKPPAQAEVTLTVGEEPPAQAEVTVTVEEEPPAQAEVTVTVTVEEDELEGTASPESIRAELPPPSSLAGAPPSEAEVDSGWGSVPPNLESAQAPSEILQAETIRRPPAPAASVLSVLHAARGFRPTTMLELLDASLSLGRQRDD